MGGNVGIGTTTPSQTLSVAGIVESTSGGFRFPDGSVQITANTSTSGSNANTSLYNLTTPTALNADILPASDNTVKLGISGQAFKEVNAINMNASAAVGTPTVSSPAAHVVMNLSDSLKEFVLSAANGIHLNFSQTTAPTAVVQSGAGTGGACALAGNDSVGTFTLTTGSTGTTLSGAQCIATFSKAWSGTNPPTCLLSPGNAAAANSMGARQIYNTTTSTTMTLAAGIAGAGANVVFIYNYHCFAAN